jgi:hypothetical protein
VLPTYRQVFLAATLTAGLLEVGTGCRKLGTLAGAAPPAAANAFVQSDDDVVTRVHSELLRDPQLTGLGIAVDGRAADVRLSGFTSTQAQIDRAVVLARDTPGVHAIHNELAVRQ